MVIVRVTLLKQLKLFGIFIEMVKEKTGLLTKESGIAKNKVLGNSPLNNNKKKN